MKIIELLQKLEHEIVSYADATGKSLEAIGEEVVDFITHKKVEGANAEAAKANPTSSGPAATSAGNQVASAGSTGSD
jgi:hypothetical protein